MRTKERGASREAPRLAAESFKKKEKKNAALCDALVGPRECRFFSRRKHTVALFQISAGRRRSRSPPRPPCSSSRFSQIRALEKRRKKRKKEKSRSDFSFLSKCIHVGVAPCACGVQTGAAAALEVVNEWALARVRTAIWTPLNLESAW